MLSIRIGNKWFHAIVIASLDYCLNVVKTGYLYGYKIQRIKIDLLKDTVDADQLKVLPLNIHI